MSNFVFNVAKGRVAYYGSLPTASDGLILVPLSTASLEADSALVKYDTLAEVLVASTEQTSLGRVVLTGVASTVDDVTNEAIVSADEVVYVAAAGPPIAALLVCYAPNVATSEDSAIIPLLKFDFSAIPNGNDIPIQFSTSGIYVATYPADRNF